MRHPPRDKPLKNCNLSHNKQPEQPPEIWMNKFLDEFQDTLEWFQPVLQQHRGLPIAIQTKPAANPRAFYENWE